MVDSIRDYAIFALDSEGKVVTWNAGARVIKGYEEEEIVGSHISRFYTPQDAATGLPAQLLRWAAEAGRVEDEGWRVRKDGTRFWADVVLTAVRNASGELQGYVKVTRDLTQRKQTEELLRQSSESLRLLIESVTDYAIYMLDSEGRVASWNRGAERIKGYRAEEIIGRHFSVFYPPEESAKGAPEAHLQGAIREGRSEDEGWRVRKDGRRFWANAVVSAIRDYRGELVGFTKVTRDMSVRRRMEQELEARALQQAAVAEIGVFALETRDLQAVLDRAVQVVARTLATDLVAIFEFLPRTRTLVLRAGNGWKDDALGGTFVADMREPAIGWLLRSGAAAVIDARSGSKLPPLLLEHGVQSGLRVGISSPVLSRPFGEFGVYSREPRKFSGDDVNFLHAVANVVATGLARTRAEEQLREAERIAHEERLAAIRAQEAIRERDEFISVAAHELRTPLTALHLKLEGMEHALQKELDVAAVESLLGARLEGALRQAERLTVLVERLLDVSRIVGERFDLNPEPCDLKDVIDEVIRGFREEAGLASTELRFRASGDTRGLWDRARIEQVLTNLLSNALKYGAGQPMDVELKGRPSAIRIAIVDRGIGISTEHLERIFSRFERAAPLSHYGGLGLGLYIARHIVEAHGGTIDVSSELGKGTSFRIELPKKVAIVPVGATATPRAAE